MQYSILVRTVLLLVDDINGTPLLALIEPDDISVEARAETIIMHTEFDAHWLELAAKAEDVLNHCCKGDIKRFISYLLTVEHNAHQEQDDPIASVDCWCEREIAECIQLQFFF